MLNKKPLKIPKAAKARYLRDKNFTMTVTIAKIVEVSTKKGRVDS